MLNFGQNGINEDNFLFFFNEKHNIGFIEKRNIILYNFPKDEMITGRQLYNTSTL